MKVKGCRIVSVFVAISLFGIYGCKKNEKISVTEKTPVPEVEEQKKVVASTSWTAAFADLAGIDKIDIIAPANLQHPPEYEITVSDIQKINECDVFIYAGFERMMKTLGDSVDNVNMIKIRCDNSIETVSSSAMTIAEYFGTQTKCNERVLDYINTIYDGKNKLNEKGLAGAKVICNVNQTYLAKDLGLEIVATYGPNTVTSEQIKYASENDFDFIIDNIHNPVAEPLHKVSPKSKYIIWRNFPERVEKDALKNVITNNINELLK